MEFEKDKLMRNINFLIKRKNIKIGELETELGVSTGYLSRLSKSDNDTVPNIDLIWKVAQKLEVSIDSLVGGDFDSSNDNLLFIINFLHSLIEDTDQHGCEWEKFSTYDKLQEKYGFSPLPMIKGKLMVLDKDGTSNKNQFESLYNTKINLATTEDNFCALVSSLGCLFLFRLETDEKESVYELYVVEDGMDEQVIPICSTLQNEGALEPTIKDLYNCFDRHERDIKISEEARKLITQYMNLRDPNKLPFD